MESKVSEVETTKTDDFGLNVCHLRLMIIKLVTEVKFHTCFFHKYLPRASCEVILQHPQLNDITWVPDDCHNGDRVTSPDIAEETLSTVKTKRTRHPKPSLQNHKLIQRKMTNDTMFVHLFFCQLPFIANRGHRVLNIISTLIK